MISFEDYIYALIGGIQVLHYENMALLQLISSDDSLVKIYEDVFYEKTGKVFKRKNEHDGSDKRPD